ncbi:ABC transporter ATP-binding protein [Brevundimonas balnearis]|uniref:ABC transporter ATP-binding protein n=1 Tax=Brevundimonas balnearis TaxID=1572858 RepID=A0ABV6QYQ7_9CAUL
MTLLALDKVFAELAGRRVLDGVDLDIATGEFVCVCGPNGAGKTSLLRAALGLLPAEGRITVADRDLREMSPRQLAERLAYLPQERRLAWNVPAVELAALGAPFLSGEAGLARGRAALDLVEAGHLADRGVAEMSGGERARVVIARALATDADLLLADEPVAGLDPDVQHLVMRRLRERAGGGRAVVATLHDLSLAARHADRIVVLANGRKVADGAPPQALSADVLRAVFGLSGVWFEGVSGPVLAVEPAQGV